MPYGFVKINLSFFFRRHGFRTITFERQDGLFLNFRQSWVMVKRKSVSFSDATRLPTPPAPNPRPNFRTPGIFFEKKICSEKNLKFVLNGQ